jgi:hypothetical protein
MAALVMGDQVMPRRLGPPEGLVDDGFRPVYEHLRDGTREQYESGWTLVLGKNTTGGTPESHTVQFDHNLGEIPWRVSVIRSIDSSGKFPDVPVDGTDYTLAYTDSDSKSGSGDNSLTITNDTTTDYYFKVRAL